MRINPVDAFLNALYPPHCILCDEIIEPIGYLCRDCSNKLCVTAEKRCFGCGMPDKKCECDRFIYHFDGVISPFYNSGNEKKAFYNYKFKENKRASEYFADKMAACVIREYSDISFDFITYVCPSEGDTEYDHSGILAARLSKILGIRLVKALAPSGKKRMIQHTLGLDNRFENVREAYKCTRSCRGKRILLVDDIKTSGATLSECALTLKLSGARSVYCVAALVGSGDNQTDCKK